MDGASGRHVLHKVFGICGLLTARERVERNSEIEGRPSLMSVRLSTTSGNIEDGHAMEGLGRDGETDEEKREEDSEEEESD